MKGSRILVGLLFGVLFVGFSGLSYAQNNPFQDEAVSIRKNTAKASILTLPLEDLVSSSEIIAIGALKDVKNTKIKTQGFEVVENVFEITRVLKGALGAGDKIAVSTLKDFEDDPKLARKQKALIFLIKDAKTNVVSFNNSVQGCWPLDSKGLPTGMGTGESLANVKKVIKNGQSNPEKKVTPVPEF